MSKDLRTGLLIASLLALILIVVTIKKNKLNIKYSIVWILWALCSLLMAIFPELFYEFADIVGVASPVNAVFLIMIGLLYGLSFYSYCAISKHNKEINNLTYEISLLKKDRDSKK